MKHKFVTPATIARERQEELDSKRRESMKLFKRKVKAKIKKDGLQETEYFKEYVQEKVSTISKVSSETSDPILLSIEIDAFDAISIINEVIQEYKDNQPKSEGGMF